MSGVKKTLHVLCKNNTEKKKLFDILPNEDFECCLIKDTNEALLVFENQDVYIKALTAISKSGLKFFPGAMCSIAKKLV